MNKAACADTRRLAGYRSREFCCKAHQDQASGQGVWPESAWLVHKTDPGAFSYCVLDERHAEFASVESQFLEKWAAVDRPAVEKIFKIRWSHCNGVVAALDSC